MIFTDMPPDARVWLIAGAGLVLIGLTGFLLTRDLVRRLLAFHITGSAALLLVLALAGGHDSPVPALLVFTGMLVGLGATLLALWLLRRGQQLAPHADADPGP
ncbi:MAG: NADH-quinone oxidoreductase subunit K [Alcanivorax sp.]|nr:NADH-quinone oxidoreductase subunit K [Alcanivorax sp.]